MSFVKQVSTLTLFTFQNPICTKLPRGFAKMNSKVQDVKEKYLNMELEEKRKVYACKGNFVELCKILTWPQYFKNKNIQPSDKADVVNTDVEISNKVSLWKGDITTLEIDAIVNAANSQMLGGGGVDGAIHRAAGSDLLKECETLNGCPAGQSKITGGYKLPAKYVIATVGPQGENPDILTSCYKNSLNLMLENNLKSIAFPCIATGIYGYPRAAAAKVALSNVREFLNQNKNKVDRVIFTVFLPEDVKVYEDLMQQYFPVE